MDHRREEGAVKRDPLADDLRRAQEANAAGDRAHNVVGDETLTAASAGASSRTFVTWIFTGNGWKKRASLLPDQPPDGFTVRPRNRTIRSSCSARRTRTGMPRREG